MGQLPFFFLKNCSFKETLLLFFMDLQKAPYGEVKTKVRSKEDMQGFCHLSDLINGSTTDG